MDIDKAKTAMKLIEELENLRQKEELILSAGHGYVVSLVIHRNGEPYAKTRLTLTDLEVLRQDLGVRQRAIKQQIDQL